jgi:hypothetical protein
MPFATQGDVGKAELPGQTYLIQRKIVLPAPIEEAPMDKCGALLLFFRGTMQ